MTRFVFFILMDFFMSKPSFYRYVALRCVQFRLLVDPVHLVVKKLNTLGDTQKFCVKSFFFAVSCMFELNNVCNVIIIMPKSKIVVKDVRKLSCNCTYYI